MMNRQKKPLYRKINTKVTSKTHAHRSGDDYRKYRRSKKRKLDPTMSKGVQHGRDYTPLYKFLLSKVGQLWDNVYKEAQGRLDKEEPIFRMVSKLSQEESEDYYRASENSYYSKLYIDEGLLQKVNPNMGPESLYPSCPCCTHTFNGIPFVNKFRG